MQNEDECTQHMEEGSLIREGCRCTSEECCLWPRLRTLSYRLPPTADAPDMTPERRLRSASGCGSCGSACRVACSAARLAASRLLSRLASFSCGQPPAFR